MSQLGDISQECDLNPLDYFHPKVNTLINKGNPPSAASVATALSPYWLLKGIPLSLYAVAFALMLQLMEAII